MAIIFSKLNRSQMGADDSCNKVFLTLDMDWACDEVLEDSLNIIESYQVTATWFITHKTLLMHRLESNEKFELGIHPNFNYLLQGIKAQFGNVDEVMENLLDIVPSARCLRSHSLTYGDIVAKSALKNNINLISNSMIPYESGIKLKSWIDWYGLMHAPYFFQDTVSISFNSKASISEMVYSDIDLKVFDFHPIHIYLNTESLDRYEKTRAIHNNPKELIKYRYDGYGTRNRLMDLLSLA